MDLLNLHNFLHRHYMIPPCEPRMHFFLPPLTFLQFLNPFTINVIDSERLFGITKRKHGKQNAASLEGKCSNYDENLTYKED